MAEWTDETVCRAAAEWIWVPDDAEVTGADFRLVNFPRWLTIGAIVASVDSNRSPSVLIEDVLEQAQRWGQPSVGWWVTAATRPLTSNLRWSAAAPFTKTPSTCWAWT